MSNEMNDAQVNMDSNTENVEAEQNNAGDTTQPTTPIPKLTKKLKLKIDQQEIDEELPFEVDENNKAQVDYLKRHLQMSKAASKRMNEAALTRKQAEQFIEALQTDPLRVLSNPKVMGEEKFRAIAEQYLSNKLQEQMLSPEERKRIEMEEKLRQYEESEKRSKEDAEQKQMAQLQEHYAQHFEKIIIDALKSSSLPKNPFTVQRMAQLLQKNLEHGLELEPSQLAQMVREDYQKELVSLIGSSDPEQIISIFGEDLTTKIRKHDLAKLKQGQPGFIHQKTPTQSVSPSPSRPMTRDEWRDYIDKKAKE